MKTFAKILCIFFLILITIAASVALCVYLLEEGPQIRPRRPIRPSLSEEKGRYKLVFGQITHTVSTPSEQVGIITQKLSVRSACFKFDTITGEVWRYKSDFYEDPEDSNKTTSFDGFVLVRD